MLSAIEKERIELKVMEELQDDYDLFDLEAELDSSLSYSEALDNILDKIDLFRDKKPDIDVIREQEMMCRLNNAKRTSSNFWKKIINNIRVLVCYGNTGTGKTALMFKILQDFSKPVYFFNHPKPELIEALGYKNMKSVSELSRLTDSVVYFDEPQLHFTLHEKKSNEMFMRLCSLARQNDLTLLFSTSDTRWVNKGLESYVSHWIIKDIDINLIKNGSAAKNIIRATMPLAINDLHLKIDEYLFYSRTDSQYNRPHTFHKPIYFDERLSKAYKHQNNATIPPIIVRQKMRT